MNIEELKKNLDYLVEKYITDIGVKVELKAYIQREGLPPVKGIMADIESKGRPIEPVDADLIKDIAFFYM